MPIGVGLKSNFQKQFVAALVRGLSRTGSMPFATTPRDVTTKLFNTVW